MTLIEFNLYKGNFAIWNLSPKWSNQEQGVPRCGVE
jgi:hypothetical protein